MFCCSRDFEFRGTFAIIFSRRRTAIAMRDKYVKDAPLADASHMTHGDRETAEEAVVSSLQNTFLCNSKEVIPHHAHISFIFVE
jgi:hypothetical protein